MQLESTTVMRAGITQSKWELELGTSNVAGSISPSRATVDFRFYLRAKGGGTTDIELRVGVADLALLMAAAAKQMPQQVLPLLAQSTHIAVSNLPG